MNNTASFGTAIGKYINEKLISLSEQQHRFPQVCEDRPLADGNGKTAYFYIYDRIAIPMAPLTEGVTPAETTLTNSEQTVTVDEQGLYVTLTTLSGLTIYHPVFKIAVERLADAIARIEDYTIHDVVNASTNKQFWDGTRADRNAITANDVYKKEVLAKMKVTLDLAGAGEREGGYYVAITDPSIIMDIVTEVGGSTFTGYSLLQSHSGNVEKTEKGLVGAWLGFKFIKTNFIAVFKLWNSGLPVVALAAGGSLSGTVYYKMVRRDTKRGFSEEIQARTAQAMSTSTRLSFTAPSTAGYAYDVYVGSADADSSCYLAVQGLVAGGVAFVDSVPTTGATAPTTPASGVKVHQICAFGKEAMDWVALTGSSQKGMMTPGGSSDSDPLDQRRKVGSKYAAKAGIRSSYRVLVCELASYYP